MNIIYTVLLNPINVRKNISKAQENNVSQCQHNGLN